MINKSLELQGVRVLATLNGLELFGHERGNIEVFKTLRELGAEVMVGVNAIENGGAVGALLREQGFTTFTMPFCNQWSWQWLKRHPLSLFTKLKAVTLCSWTFHHTIRKFRPTHIHLGSPLAYSYLALALAIHKDPLIYRMGDATPIDSPFNLRIWRMAMRRSTYIVANSKFVLNLALDSGVEPKKISVIHNLAPSRTEQASLSEKPRKLTDLIYVGAISEHKGLVPLIEAFTQLSSDYPLMCLNILGGSRYDIPFREQLKQMVAANNLANRVFFHGHLNDTSSFLKSSAIHVAPAIWEEPFANVVLEAKHEGTPSIVFPSGGLPEMVRHQIDGYICQEKSVDALVEGLRWMLEDPIRLKRMGEAAREDSEARFGKARFVKAWANIYLTAKKFPF